MIQMGHTAYKARAVSQFRGADPYTACTGTIDGRAFYCLLYLAYSMHYTRTKLLYQYTAHILLTQNSKFSQTTPFPMMNVKKNTLAREG